MLERITYYPISLVKSNPGCWRAVHVGPRALVPVRLHYRNSGLSTQIVAATLQNPITEESVFEPELCLPLRISVHSPLYFPNGYPYGPAKLRLWQPEGVFVLRLSDDSVQAMTVVCKEIQQP